MSVLPAFLSQTCRRDRVSPLDARGQEPGTPVPWGHSPRREGGECPARLSVAPHERDALRLQAGAMMSKAVTSSREPKGELMSAAARFGHSLTRYRQGLLGEES